MTYYVRAYCTDGEVPTIGTVLAWAGEHGLDLDPPPDMPEFVSWVGEPPPDWDRRQQRSWPAGTGMEPPCGGEGLDPDDSHHPRP
jgi:hypothetical protein